MMTTMMMPQRGRETSQPPHAFFRRRVMGSTGSLLNEGVYEKDTGDHDAHRRPRYRFDEHMLPSKIMPYSGRPDKGAIAEHGGVPGPFSTMADDYILQLFLNPKGLIRPIAVRPPSPGSASSSPGFTKRGVESPALSDTAAVHGQPPDVVLTNQRRGTASPNGFMPGGNHFSRPPTKAVSLQEISPAGGHSYSNGVMANQESRARPPHKKLQPSQSMNYLDQSRRRNQPQQLERRGRSYSHSSIHDHHHQDTSHISQLNHSSLSPPPEHRTASYDNQSVSSHVSSIIEEISTDEEAPALRNRIQELEAQLVSLRQAMEQNEESILQVQEDKRQEWQSELERMKKESKQQREEVEEREQNLQIQVLQLEQENSRLRQKTERFEEASQNLRNSSHQSSKLSNESPSTRGGSKNKNTRHMIDENFGETASLREKVDSYQRQLIQERERVEKLEQELEQARTNKWQETPDLVKKQGGGSEMEVKRLRTSLDQLSEVKLNLSKQVSIQEDELQSLQQKLEERDKEIAQDISELAYLKDIQDGLHADLKAKDKEVRQLKKAERTLRAEMETRVREKELEVEAVHCELRELRLKQNQEISELEKQVLRKESEVLQLQAQVQDNEVKAKGKRRSLKGSEASKSAQKQLEQDFIALQWKLTKREQELFQFRREATLKQENIKEERDSAKKKLEQHERDLKACREKLQCKDEELLLFSERLQEREKEIAGLYDKLDQQQMMEPSGVFLAGGGGGVDEKEDGRLSNSDVVQLKSNIRNLEKKLRRQEAEFEEERLVWQKEKSQVLQYQKQLQLNYMQMGQKNHKLEKEIQQLTSELDRSDVIHC